MKFLYLFVFIILTFLSCSKSSDEPVEDRENMQMEDDMEMNDTMEMEEETVGAYSGDFVSASHPTSGVVSVNDGKTKLIFENFSTDDGPLLEVYLATDTSVSDFISLGGLKGTMGNYEYDLPENIDYSTYNHVIIWCVTFSVNFGYAVLK